MATDDDVIPDKATTPRQKEAFRRAEGDEGEAQRILMELREENWTPPEDDSTSTGPASGSPPSGSETIQDGQPRESGSDRVQQNPVEQTTDTTEMRPPTGGPPGGSETIPDDQQPDGQPRESASQPEDRPTQEELEGVNLNTISDERAQELIGRDITQEQFQGDFATSIGQDEQRRATGSPVRPTDPQFEEDASLEQLAAAVSNPTIQLSSTGRTRLAQQSPVKLAALGLSGGEIRGVSPAIDTSDDLQREENFRETFSEEEAQQYLQARSQEMQRLRNRPGPTERQATEEEQEQLQSIEEEAAAEFEEQLGIDVSEGDVQLERTNGGIQPTLRSGVQRDIQQERLTEAREAIASRLDQRTDTDVTPEDVTFDFASETAGVDEQTESEILQERREEAAAAIRQQAGAQTQETGVSALETTGGSIAASSILANVTSEDLEQQDGQLQLDTEIQKQVGAARFGVDTSDVIVDDGEIRVTEEFQREQTREQFTDAFNRREDAIESARGSIERDLEQQLPRLTGQEVRGGRGGLGTVVGGGDIDLGEDDFERTSEGVRLTESGIEEFEASQFEAAREVIDEQLPTEVGRGDITRRDGQITLSEQGRTELEEFQEQQATEELLSQLQSETGADLTESDIDVEATQKDGETRFQARLTESGQRELAGEQVPGSDLPVVGGALEKGGETAAGVEQTFLDVGDAIEDAVPDVDVPEIELPSAEEVTAASAAGVAAPEPITSGAGLIGLAAVGGTAATVAAANKAGLGQGPPTARAGFTQDQRSGELPVQDPTQGTTEVAVPSVGEFFRAEQQTPSQAQETASEVGLGTGITDSEVSVPEQGQIDPRTLQTQQLIQQGVGEQRGVIDDILPPEELPEPREQPPSVRERQRRDDLFTPQREFPTGESAVIGRGETSELQEEATDLEVELPEESLPSETGVRGLDPVTGVFGDDLGEGVTERQTESEDEFTEPTPIEDVTTEPQSQQETQVKTRPQTAQRQALDTDLASILAGTQPATPTEPAFPSAFGTPEEPAFPEVTTQAPRQRTPRRPELPEIDLDGDSNGKRRRPLGIDADEFDNPVLGPGQAFEFDPFGE